MAILSKTLTSLRSVACRSLGKTGYRRQEMQLPPLPRSGWRVQSLKLSVIGSEHRKLPNSMSLGRSATSPSSLPADALPDATAPRQPASAFAATVITEDQAAVINAGGL